MTQQLHPLTRSQVVQLLNTIHISESISTTKEIDYGMMLIRTVRENLSTVFSTLAAVYESGPLYDGDIPSPTARNRLLDLHMIIKIVVKGEDGWNACTHIGRDAYRVFLALKEMSV